VVVDESYPRCGLASDIVAQVSQACFEHLRAAPQTVTPPHVPPPFAPSLEDLFVPSVERIVDTVRASMGGKVATGA
jgi:pyruvate dehydrogenase E1 component beta subunit